MIVRYLHKLTINFLFHIRLSKILQVMQNMCCIDPSTAPTMFMYAQLEEAENLHFAYYKYKLYYDSSSYVYVGSKYT